MPAGPATIGILAFAGIKLAGYCGAAAFLNRRRPEQKPNVLLVGATRTVIGLVAGIGAVGALEALGIFRSEWMFFALLVPLRMGEWLLLLRLFYVQPSWEWRPMSKLAGWGTLWSFGLDVPAVAAVFTVPGGMWIC